MGKKCAKELEYENFANFIFSGRLFMANLQSQNAIKKNFKMNLRDQRLQLFWKSVVLPFNYI